jgi:hypothetical protein
MSPAWWQMPVVPATWETDIGGLRCEVGPGERCETLPRKIIKSKKKRLPRKHKSCQHGKLLSPEGLLAPRSLGWGSEQQKDPRGVGCFERMVTGQGEEAGDTAGLFPLLLPIRAFSGQRRALLNGVFELQTGNSGLPQGRRARQTPKSEERKVDSSVPVSWMTCWIQPYLKLCRENKDSSHLFLKPLWVAILLLETRSLRIPGSHRVPRSSCPILQIRWTNPRAGFHGTAVMWPRFEYGSALE